MQRTVKIYSYHSWHRISFRVNMSENIMKLKDLLLKTPEKLNTRIEHVITASLSDMMIGKYENESTKLKSVSLILRLFFKRFIDFTLASMFLLMSLPLFIIIAIIIKIDSRGPVFFKQERLGLNSKKFYIYKFRTMVHFTAAEDHKTYIRELLKNEQTTEEARADLLQKYIEYVNGKVTKTGHFLRQSSLDEIPQLFNIIIGSMSLVGPRPHPTYEVKEYKDWYLRRLNVKPGLTGWSKIHLRLTPQNYEEAILLDLWYVDNWSVLLDIKIILMTIPFVLSMRDVH